MALTVAARHRQTQLGADQRSEEGEITRTRSLKNYNEEEIRTHLSTLPTQSDTYGKPYTVDAFDPQRLKSSTVRL